MGRKKQNETVRKKSDAELEKERVRCQSDLLDLQFDVAGTQKKNNKQRRELKRERARIMTEQRRRERTAEEDTHTIND